MSDYQQGPEWWQASDGKWYPPEQHPGGGGSEPSQAAGAPYHPGAGPGGEPYQPAAGPAGAPYEPPGPYAPPAGGAPPDAGPPTYPGYGVPGGPAAGQPAGAARAGSRSIKRTPALIAAVVAVVVVVVVLIVALGGSSNSPQGVANSIASDLSAGNFSAVCNLAVPSQVASCQNDVSQLTTQGVTYQHLAVGHVTQQGNEALVALTGSACVNGQCVQSNNDPNLVADSGQTFDQVYATAISSSSSNSSPFIVPLVDYNGTWRATGF